uniref:Uncharacterized protein n=1 Tax=Picea glauca TaxID=3330 RepID=A0A117NJ86_PICGL|nr:hypothetical protein ABT39_MTgene944 [Picea glauca]QHR86392.1 hypothetical protein Q903MT_gene391 [Picea sitchensis]
MIPRGVYRTGFRMPLLYGFFLNVISESVPIIGLRWYGLNGSRDHRRRIFPRSTFTF